MAPRMREPRSPTSRWTPPPTRTGSGSTPPTPSSSAPPPTWAAPPPPHAFAKATSGRYLTSVWADKIAAGFTNSASKSGDKLYTLNFMAALAAQHRMIWVDLGLPPGWNALTASEDNLNRLGSWIGAGASPLRTAPAASCPISRAP